MKHMKEVVAAINKALATLEQHDSIGEFERVAKALAESKVKKIDVISKALRCLRPSQQPSAGALLGALLPILRTFHELLVAVGAKKKNVEDLKAVLDLVAEYHQLSIGEFCQALSSTTIGERLVDHQLVESYLDKLEKTLGDEQRFPLVYKALADDKRIAQPEAVELASRFLAPVAKSTSRPKALRRVLFRHEKLIESRAASASIGARR